jgi:hypothetical protein
MGYDTGEKHLVEINHVSILESVDEVFDGISSMMTENAVLYGSTITALLTGLPIRGDLDVAASASEFMTLAQNIASSTKWIQVEGSSIPEKHGDSGRRLGGVRASAGNPYGDARHLPVNDVVAFTGVNDARIQVVKSRTMTGDPLEDALQVVRKVDFVFCGLAVDKYGRVLEVIPGAYSDNSQRVIRILDYQHRLDPTRLRARFRKYLDRGYSLGVAIDTAMANLKKAKAEYEARMMAKKKKFSIKKKRYAIWAYRPTGGDVTINTAKELSAAVGSSTWLRDVVRHYAMNDFHISLLVKQTTSGGLTFWADPNGDIVSMSMPSATRIIDKVKQHIGNQKGVDVDRLMDKSASPSPQLKYKAQEYKTSYSSYATYTSSTSSSTSTY